MTPDPTFDVHGYPTPKTLTRIRRWPVKATDDIDDVTRDWLAYCRAAWNLTYGRVTEEDDGWHFITGGWSGNEDVIWAMRDRWTLWLCWESSERGGLHILRTRGR